MESALYDAGWSSADVQKVKIWNSGYPKEPQLGFCSISATRNAVQNDDADQQTSGSTSRDMGDQGCVLVEGCTVENHRGECLFLKIRGFDTNRIDSTLFIFLSDNSNA